MKEVLRWVWVLGLAGFAGGFFGPMVLDPSANQGPLLGILITGPGGALAGLVAGLAFAILPVSEAAQRRLRGALAATLVLGTLWYALPQPRTSGYLLEAAVTACREPVSLEEAALADWDARVAEVTWAPARAGWKDEARRLFARPDGVVLDLEVHARRASLEHRRPWDRGRITVAEVAGVGEISRVFVRASCAAYPPGPVSLYYETTKDPQPGPWPPDDLPGLLNLVVAGPPPDYFAGSSSG
ncbi:MAG: hypothetical protein CMLOHMNK_02435 [Steroidobacteraceae bacterium]|nr:hypothetical protein [Steroidobacteraceae bacterium]